jgi:hypothetical protein
MGQQVRYETLEQAAGLLHRAVQSRDPIVLRRVMLGEQEVTRAEVRYLDLSKQSRTAHVYETYWAPLTEGKVGLKDVFLFLQQAAVAGFRRTFREFDRWMFGQWHRFRINLTSSFGFLAALLVIVSLGLTNAVVGAVVTSGALLATVTGWPTPALLSDLTVDLTLFLGAALLALIAVWLSAWWGARRLPLQGAITWVAWRFVWLSLLTTMALGFAVAWQLWLHHEGDVLFFWSPRVRHGLLFADLYARWKTDEFLHLGVVWGLALIVSYFVRKFLIQYVGDVAAYVSAHTVSRFDELREEIRARAFTLARAVYHARGSRPDTLAYERVIVLGHSLGSVIAYDTLNALMRQETLAAKRCWVEARTKLFLTFGSPLDKIAFVFRSQAKGRLDVREAAAATMQPLIEDYAFRPQRWVNLFTPNDWIGGSLEYFDNPQDALYSAQGVKNELDTEATTPLAAHSELWSGTLLAKHLAAAVR